MENFHEGTALKHALRYMHTESQKYACSLEIGSNFGNLVSWSTITGAQPQARDNVCRRGFGRYAVAVCEHLL